MRPLSGSGSHRPVLARGDTSRADPGAVLTLPARKPITLIPANFHKPVIKPLARRSCVRAPLEYATGFRAGPDPREGVRPAHTGSSITPTVSGR